MPPYLKTVTSFADVPVTEPVGLEPAGVDPAGFPAGVDTVKFLEAASGLVGIFDLLGSTAFLPVKQDLKGNITKVQTRYDAARSLSLTLESLVENEKSERKRVATQGLLWLLRGLSFTCKALQFSQKNKSQELKLSFSDSYVETLKKHHSFYVKPVFSLALSACPSRASFYEKLAADPDGGPSVGDDELNEQLDKWLEALDQIITRMQKFYEEGKHDEGF